jgi:folate-binding protein YgfZ
MAHTVSSQHTAYDVADGAGWIDKRRRGRLRFDGRDAAAFLHALVSHDVESLQAGHGVYATYLTPQGRMLADLRIHHRGDHLLVDVPPGLAESLAQRLDASIFTEDVRVSNASESIAELAVVGESAAAATANALGIDLERVAGLALWAQAASGDAVAVRTDDVAAPSFDIFVPTAAFDGVIARLAQAGAIAIPDSVADALRIEAGRPLFGVDMTTDTIPLEAGLLDRAISQTKGCYVGQEIIVRVLHRGGGRVARRLVTLELDPPATAPPQPGAPILADDRETGHVTSAAWSPRLARVIALGYVHRDAAEAGRRVVIRAGAVEALGRVTGLAG